MMSRAQALKAMNQTRMLEISRARMILKNKTGTECGKAI
jgi:hypothetical protein